MKTSKVISLMVVIILLSVFIVNAIVVYDFQIKSNPLKFQFHVGIVLATFMLLLFGCLFMYTKSLPLPTYPIFLIGALVCGFDTWLSLSFKIVTDWSFVDFITFLFIGLIEMIIFVSLGISNRGHYWSNKKPEGLAQV